jgi:DNA-binding CsgD family transcriptional regulator
LIVQAICAALFMFNTFSAFIGWAPIPWTLYEFIEIGAAVGLVLGSALGAVALRRSLARTARVEAQLRAASGAFGELLEERFAEWGLTPAERDVALFSIKGMSIQEIAALRSTSDGTVKAQTNAIYRKAGVSGRPQLLSLFIEDLMDGPVGGPKTELSSPEKDDETKVVTG